MRKIQQMTHFFIMRHGVHLKYKCSFVIFFHPFKKQSYFSIFVHFHCYCVLLNTKQAERVLILVEFLLKYSFHVSLYPNCFSVPLDFSALSIYITMQCVRSNITLQPLY